MPVVLGRAPVGVAGRRRAPAARFAELFLECLGRRFQPLLVVCGEHGEHVRWQTGLLGDAGDEFVALLLCGELVAFRLNRGNPLIELVHVGLARLLLLVVGVRLLLELLVVLELGLVLLLDLGDAFGQRVAELLGRPRIVLAASAIRIAMRRILRFGVGRAALGARVDGAVRARIGLRPEVGVVQFRHCCFLYCVVRTVSDAACGVRDAWWMQDLHLRGSMAADLQSAPVGYCGNPPYRYGPRP